MSAWPSELIPHVRAMLPPLDDVTAVEDPVDFGPRADLPAIYVHLLLLRIEKLESEALISSLTRCISDRPARIEAEAWPSAALRLMTDVAEGGDEAAMSHVALPITAVQDVMRYIGRIEAELAVIPSEVNEMRRAAMVRAVGGVIVGNVESLSDDLGPRLRAAAISQAVREINTLVRRLIVPAAS